MTQVQKLSRQADTGGEQHTIVPKGWGRPAVVATALQPGQQAEGVVTTAVQNVEEQRERIQATLKGAGGADEQEGPTPAERARAAFSPAIRAQLEAENSDEAGNYAAQAIFDPKVPTQEAATGSPAPSDVPKATRQRRSPTASVAAPAETRIRALELAIEHCRHMGERDVIPVANDMLLWLTAA